MTLQEYENSQKGTRLMYRLYRNPVVLIGLGALFNFLLSNRLPSRSVQRKERMSVLFTNLLIVSVFIAAPYVIGWQTYLLIQLPVLWLAGARTLAVLRPASVRGRILGKNRRVGPSTCRDGRQLLLQIARSAALVPAT